MNEKMEEIMDEKIEKIEEIKDERDEWFFKLCRLTQEMQDAGYVFRLNKVVIYKHPVEKTVVTIRGEKFLSKADEEKLAALDKKERQGEFIGAVVEAAYLGGYNVTTTRFEDGKISAFFDPVKKDTGTIEVLHL